MATEKQLAQRKAAAARGREVIAAQRRAKETCKRGHNNWRISVRGHRRCRTCDTDREWYARRGLGYA